VLDRLMALVDRTRAEQGPFFVARVALRLSFAIERVTRERTVTAEHVDEFVRACRELGYDPR